MNSQINQDIHPENISPSTLDLLKQWADYSKIYFGAVIIIQIIGLISGLSVLGMRINSLEDMKSALASILGFSVALEFITISLYTKFCLYPLKISKVEPIELWKNNLSIIGNLGILGFFLRIISIIVTIAVINSIFSISTLEDAQRLMVNAVGINILSIIIVLVDLGIFGTMKGWADDFDKRFHTPAENPLNKAITFIFIGYVISLLNSFVELGGGDLGIITLIGGILMLIGYYRFGDIINNAIAKKPEENHPLGFQSELQSPSPSSLFCPQCGGKNEPTNQFCGTCGQKLREI